MPDSLNEKANGSALDMLLRVKSPALVKNKRNIQARAHLPLTVAKENEAAKIPGRPSYKIFTVTFPYLQHIHELKVMKVSRDYAFPIYKFVLSSAMKSNAWVCWLQRQSKTWRLLLGNDVDEILIAAICSAIYSQE